MKIGFIGCGNMARPIIGGLAESGLIAPADILVTDINTESAEPYCMSLGVSFETQDRLLAQSDVLVLAVKPQTLPSLLPQIADAVNRRNIFVLSIAAGKTTDWIGSFFADTVAVARIFPNLNARVKAAVSAYCGNKNTTAEQLSFVGRLCGTFGSAFPVEEEKIGVFGVLGGCAPAYTFLYIDALAKAAEQAGLEPAFALEVAAAMAEGSAKLLLSSDESAGSLVKKVCSPGGTTIEGVRTLEDAHFSDLVADAFSASLRRDRELSQLS